MTASKINGDEGVFQVTHPFHPLFGRKFVLVDYRPRGGDERVFYHDEKGRLLSLPACWTSAFPPDPFVVMASGQSAFRIVDLLELARLIQGLSDYPNELEREGQTKSSVRQITP